MGCVLVWVCFRVCVGDGCLCVYEEGGVYVGGGIVCVCVCVFCLLFCSAVYQT